MTKKTEFLKCEQSAAIGMKKLDGKSAWSSLGKQARYIWQRRARAALKFGLRSLFQGAILAERMVRSEVGRPDQYYVAILVGSKEQADLIIKQMSNIMHGKHKAHPDD